MGSLVVRRQKVRWQDLIRDYVIFVDGQEVARVKNGSEAEIPLPAGKHRVQVRIDWGRSPELEVDVDGDEPTAVECGPNANPLTVLAYASIFWRRYLWLRHASPSA